MNSHVAASSPAAGYKTKKEVGPVEIFGVAIVVILWVAFAAAVFFSQSSIHEIWAWFKDQSFWMQLPLGILFLPWLIGMWIWETSWPLAARGALVGALAWANVYTFSPWKPV